MQNRQTVLTRKSSCTTNFPSSRINDQAKYITKEEFDQMLNKHFLEAVDNVKLAVIETVKEVLCKPEVNDIIIQREYYKEKCEKLQESRYKDHQEFAKITAEYQNILVNACGTILNNEDPPSRHDEPSRVLRNIGVLRRSSSLVDVDQNAAKRF